jgi:hypothetical protein
MTGVTPFPVSLIATAALLGGTGNLAAATLSQDEGKDEDGEDGDSSILIAPSPHTVDAIESALRETLQMFNDITNEDHRALVKQYQQTLVDLLARPNSFLRVGPGFFKSPDGKALLASIDNIRALLEDAANGQLPTDEESSGSIVPLHHFHPSQDPCDASPILGIGDMTIGALTAGPLGATVGFVRAVGLLVAGSSTTTCANRLHDVLGALGSVIDAQ